MPISVALNVSCTNLFVLSRVKNPGIRDANSELAFDRLVGSSTDASGCDIKFRLRTISCPLDVQYIGSTDQSVIGPVFGECFTCPKCRKVGLGSAEHLPICGPVDRKAKTREALDDPVC
jgi:hypothetical protein